MLSCPLRLNVVIYVSVARADVSLVDKLSSDLLLQKQKGKHL